MSETVQAAAIVRVTRYTKKGAVKEARVYGKLEEPMDVVNELLDAGWKIVEVEFLKPSVDGAFGHAISGTIKARKNTKRERERFAAEHGVKS